MKFVERWELKRSQLHPVFDRGNSPTTCIKGIKNEGWYTKNIDKTKVTELTPIMSWGEEITARKFSSALKEVCDRTIRRRRGDRKFRPYWWNSEIVFKRNEAGRKRRCHTNEGYGKENQSDNNKTTYWEKGTEFPE